MRFLSIVCLTFACLAVANCSIQLCSFDEAELVISQWREFSYSANGGMATIQAGSYVFKR